MVFRVNKNKDYTVMSNYHIKDKNLSLKAKGLLSVMLSLPDNWDYSIQGLVSISKENETAIKSTLKELKDFRYLKIEKSQNKKGQFDYVYNIFENPQVDNPVVETPKLENPKLENPPMENPKVENQGQLNTKESNTKELNTNNKTEATPQTPVVEKDSKVDDKSSKSKKENIFEDFANGNTQLLQALKDFEESRIKNRKKMTDKAKQLLISRLKSFSSNPYDWIAMLENAILNGWQTVYELNGNQQRVTNGYQPRYDEWNWGNNNGNM